MVGTVNNAIKLQILYQYLSPVGAHLSTALALDSFTTFPISDTTPDGLHKYLAIDIIFANCCKRMQGWTAWYYLYTSKRVCAMVSNTCHWSPIFGSNAALW